MPLNKKIRSLL